MNFYNCSVSYEPKVIGVRNGVYQVAFGDFSFESEGEYERLWNFFMPEKYFSRENKIPDFELSFKKVKVLKKAKLTDFMGYSQRLVGAPFVISKKAVTVLQEFNIQEHFLYPMNLYDSDGEPIEAEYYLFYCPFLEFDVIDFSNSVIYTGNDLLGNKKYHQINSLTEFNDFKKKVSLFDFEKIAIKSNHQLDLYYLRAATGVFVSERLKEVFEKNKLTALRFRREPTLQVN